MATKKLVTKVWIAPGCIVCDACETTCPEVFDVQEESCVIRPEALDAEFLKPLTQSVEEAAEECPVEVIKFETVEVEVEDTPRAAPAASAPAVTAPDGEEGSAAAPTSATPAMKSAAASGTAVDAMATNPPATPAGATAAQAAPPDPAIQALLKATTARGGKAGHQGAADVPPAVKALRNRKIDELPPDARYARVLEAARTQKSGEKPSRRAVITAAGVGWLSTGVAAGVSGLALQRFMFPNVLEEPDPRVRLGELAKFAEMPVGAVNEDYKPQGIWIIRLEGEIAALSTTCTHLGCIPNWQEGERKFKCPCHGSGFMQSGINFEGPAPRPLERFQLSVEDGIVVVNRAKKFQQEKGEWSNPDSFITV